MIDELDKESDFIYSVNSSKIYVRDHIIYPALELTSDFKNSLGNSELIIWGALYYGKNFLIS